MTLKRTALLRRRPDADYASVPVRKEAKPAKGPKPKFCASCRESFVAAKMGQKVCGLPCSIAYGKAVTHKQSAKAARIERAETKAKLLQMEPAAYWRKKAKTALHAVIRAEAEGQPCISCDTLLLKLGRMGGDYDAGHFRPVGLAKHLEFDRRNIWGQCKYCNDHLRGNFQEYERRLRIKKGDAFVDELLADNEPRHLKIPDYQQIETEAKSELRAITRSRT